MGVGLQKSGSVWVSWGWSGPPAAQGCSCLQLGGLADGLCGCREGFGFPPAWGRSALLSTRSYAAFCFTKTDAVVKQNCGRSPRCTFGPCGRKTTCRPEGWRACRFVTIEVAPLASGRLQLCQRLVYCVNPRCQMLQTFFMFFYEDDMSCCVFYFSAHICLVNCFSSTTHACAYVRMCMCICVSVYTFVSDMYSRQYHLFL